MRSKDRHCVWVLEQRLEVRTRGELVDSPGVDDADIEVIDIEELGHHDVDAARQ
jgi:hypothetical protein